MLRSSAIAGGCFRLIMGGLFRRLGMHASGSPHSAGWAHAGYEVLEDHGAGMGDDSGLQTCLARLMR